MFIGIVKFMTALEVENKLLPCKRGVKKITPELCCEVLAATNFKRNIRDMLECVAVLPVKEQARFRDVVLSTFDRREQPNDIAVLGKKLATAGGYSKELEEIAAFAKEGIYLKSAAGNPTWFVTAQEDFSMHNLARYPKMKFTGARAELKWAENVPEELDASMCDYVGLAWCDLQRMSALRFKEGAEVDFSNAENLPRNLDVSMCRKVNLDKCDLGRIKSLTFGAGAEVELCNAANLPEELDVSMCASVKLSECFLAVGKTVKFKNRAQMQQSGIKFPDGQCGKAVFAVKEEENELAAAAVAAKKRNGR